MKHGVRERKRGKKNERETGRERRRYLEHSIGTG